MKTVGGGGRMAFPNADQTTPAQHDVGLQAGHTDSQLPRCWDLATKKQTLGRTHEDLALVKVAGWHPCTDQIYQRLIQNGKGLSFI